MAAGGNKAQAQQRGGAQPPPGGGGSPLELAAFASSFFLRFSMVVALADAALSSWLPSPARSSSAIQYVTICIFLSRGLQDYSWNG